MTDVFNLLHPAADPVLLDEVQERGGVIVSNDAGCRTFTAGTDEKGNRVLNVHDEGRIPGDAGYPFIDLGRRRASISISATYKFI
ncbi:hypothetical protein HY345_03195 [Candidatus Microgenomates bacterium]|nr:hypothetical protein [Candidatus Microgenomates bacterium]